MLSIYKCFSNKRFEADKVINRPSLVAKATLNINNETVAFQEPDQSCVYHPFKSFTETASQGYRTVIVGVTRVLSWFGYRDDQCLFPGRGEVSGLPNVIKYI